MEIIKRIDCDRWFWGFSWYYSLPHPEYQNHVDCDQRFWEFVIMLYDDQQSWFCSVPHIESRSCCSFWSKFPLHCPPCTGIQCHQHHCHHHDHDNYHCRRRMVNIIIPPKHCLVLTYQFFCPGFIINFLTYIFNHGHALGELFMKRNYQHPPAVHLWLSVNYYTPHHRHAYQLLKTNQHPCSPSVMPKRFHT